MNGRITIGVNQIYNFSTGKIIYSPYFVDKKQEELFRQECDYGSIRLVENENGSFLVAENKNELLGSTIYKLIPERNDNW